MTWYIWIAMTISQAQIIMDQLSNLSTGYQTLPSINKGDIYGSWKVRYFSFKCHRHYRSFSQSSQKIWLGTPCIHGRYWYKWNNIFRHVDQTKISDMHTQAFGYVGMQGIGNVDQSLPDPLIVSILQNLDNNEQGKKNRWQGALIYDSQGNWGFKYKEIS